MRERERERVCICINVLHYLRVLFCLLLNRDTTTPWRRTEKPDKADWSSSLKLYRPERGEDRREAYNQCGKYASLVFQSLPGYANSGEAVVYDGQLLQANAFLYSASAETSTGKMIAPPFARASSARSIHRVSIFSAFSLPLISPPTITLAFPSRADAFGQFLFHRALTSLARVVLTRRPHERTSRP